MAAYGDIIAARDRQQYCMRRIAGRTGDPARTDQGFLCGLGSIYYLAKEFGKTIEKGLNDGPEGLQGQPAQAPD